MAYQYCETDPYKKSTQLLEANPRGLVPAIREGDWASGESSVILEYVSISSRNALPCRVEVDFPRLQLEDRHNGLPLFPTDPRLKANCRFWIDHVRSEHWEKLTPTSFHVNDQILDQRQHRA